VVLGYEQYEKMMETYEDAQDIESIKDYEKRLAKNIPWDKAKKDLGL
jgi:hypothetical protein